MNVLLLTQVLPYPPDSGPKIKTLNVLKYLSGRHDVTLLSFVRGDQWADVVALSRICKAVHTVPLVRNRGHDAVALARSLWSRTPWMIVRDDRAAMRAAVDRLLARERFDVVHADQANMAQYALRAAGTRRILDAHNALWLLYRRLWEASGAGPQRWVLSRDWKLLRSYEGRLCRVFDRVLTVSPEDRDALVQAGAPADRITVMPISMDVDQLLPVDRSPSAHHILHIGTMFWPPNIDGVRWFLNEILPRIREARPDVVFDLVGARPPLEFVSAGKGRPGLNVTGYVEDTRPFMERAAVFVVPLRAGGGMRVKILEALARALPVVSTTIGAEGIAVRDGEHILIADTPADFAAAVLKLLRDRALADRIGLQGRRLVETTYDYRLTCRALDDVYLSGQERKPGGGPEGV